MYNLGFCVLFIELSDCLDTDILRKHVDIYLVWNTPSSWDLVYHHCSWSAWRRIRRGGLFSTLFAPLAVCPMQYPSFSYFNRQVRKMYSRVTAKLVSARRERTNFGRKSEPYTREWHKFAAQKSRKECTIHCKNEITEHFKSKTE